MDTLTYTRIRTTQNALFANKKVDSLLIQSLNKEISIFDKQKTTYKLIFEVQEKTIAGLQKDLFKERKRKKYLVWALPVVLIAGVLIGK